MVVLEILGTKIEDSGEYTCRATNKWGKAEISVNLDCVDKSKGQKPQFTSQIQVNNDFKIDLLRGINVIIIIFYYRALQDLRMEIQLTLNVPLFLLETQFLKLNGSIMDNLYVTPLVSRLCLISDLWFWTLLMFRAMILESMFARLPTSKQLFLYILLIN